MSKPYTYTTEKLKRSEFRITGEVEMQYLDTFRKASLANITSRVVIDGFRKGKAPEARVVAHVGEQAILTDMAERALKEVYLEIILSEKIDAIGVPEISITKLAPGNPLGFIFKTAVMPTIELGYYKEIAKGISFDPKENEISGEEIEQALLELRKMKTHSDAVAKSKELGEEKMPSRDDVRDEDLPELTDAVVAEFGNFENVAAFKKALTENMAHEKEHKNKDKRRILLIEAILEKSNIDIPNILIDHELRTMLAEFDYDLSLSGVTMEDYLAKANKTGEELLAEWRGKAEKRAGTQLIISKIAQIESLAPDIEKVSKEVASLKERYKDNTNFDEMRAHAYVDSVLTNQRVLEWLEEQAK